MRHLGPVGALGVVAANHAVEGRRADRESATRHNTEAAPQFVRVLRQNQDPATPMNALWIHLGPIGALGAAAARPVEQGHRAELESAMRLNTMEAQQSAQALRQNRETATPMHALWMHFGLVGAHGAAVVKPAEEGRKVEQEIAMWPSTAEAPRSAQALRQPQDRAIATLALLDVERIWIGTSAQAATAAPTNRATVTTTESAPRTTSVGTTTAGVTGVTQILRLTAVFQRLNWWEALGPTKETSLSAELPFATMGMIQLMLAWCAGCSDILMGRPPFNPGLVPSRAHSTWTTFNAWEAKPRFSIALILLWTTVTLTREQESSAQIMPLWMRHGAPGALGEAAASLVGLVAQAVMG